MIPPTNVKQALTAAAEKLQASSDTARLDAETLLCHLLDCNSAHLAAWPEKLLDNELANRFSKLIEQRVAGEPVAYLTHHREFWSLDFSPATLIPRPETEMLVAYVLEHFSERISLNLLDLGTGSGAIAIALATEKPGWQITACDISTEALEIARANALRHHAGHVNFITSDWFQAINQQRFDVIVSNPPYIALDDPHMQLGDVRFEPATALLSGDDGMKDIRNICRQAKHHINQDGWITFEHGYNQKQPAYDCLIENGFCHIQQRHDFAGQPRISAGQTLQPNTP